MFDYNKYSMESDYLAYINELRIATDAIIGGNVMYRAFSMKNGFDANYMHRAMSPVKRWNPKLSTLELIAQEAESSLPSLLARIEGQALTPQEEQSFIDNPITKADLVRYIYYITPPKLTVALVLAKDMRLNAPETPLYANRHKEQGTLTFKTLHTSAFMIGMTPYSFCKGAHERSIENIRNLLQHQNPTLKENDNTRHMQS